MTIDHIGSTGNDIEYGVKSALPAVHLAVWAVVLAYRWRWAP